MSRWLVSFVVLGLFAADADARILRVRLVDDLPEVKVPVRVGDTVEFHVPEPMIHWSMGNKVHYSPLLQDRGFILALQIAPSAPPTTLHIKTWNYKLTARLFLFDPKDEPVTRVEGLRPLHEQQSSPEEVEGAWVAKVRKVKPFSGAAWAEDGQRLKLKSGIVQIGDDVALIPIVVRNLGDFEFPVHGPQIHDHKNRPVRAKIVRKKGLDGPEPAIRPNEEVEITFQVSPASQIAKGARLFMAPAAISIDLDAPPPPPPPPPGPLQDHVAVSVRYFGGAANLSDGLVPATSEWTSVWGVGFRALYGVTRHISIEGSGDFAWTGTADLGATRQVRETSGRIQAAGLLHTGERLIPFGRLGLGVQVARSTLEATGDSEIVAGLVVSYGGGLAARVSDRLMAGLSVAYNAPMAGNNERQWFEADLSLGWVWGPGRRSAR